MVTDEHTKWPFSESVPLVQYMSAPLICRFKNCGFDQTQNWGPPWTSLMCLEEFSGKEVTSEPQRHCAKTASGQPLAKMDEVVSGIHSGVWDPLGGL